MTIASIGLCGIEIKHTALNAHLSKLASIGLCGIEIKPDAAERPTRSLASIGLCGIEMLAAQQFYAYEESLQSDCVVLKSLCTISVKQLGFRFNRTVWY